MSYCGVFSDAPGEDSRGLGRGLTRQTSGEDLVIPSEKRGWILPEQEPVLQVHTGLLPRSVRSPR